MSDKAFDAFVDELKQCAAGSRGWVDCSIRRARRMGLAHANLTVAAEVLGLVVERHGGPYIAHRAAVAS